MTETALVSNDNRNETVTIEGGGGVVILKSEDATVISVGIQGPSGAVTGADLHYETTFTNLATVTVTHNLGKFPAVSVFDSANDEVVGDVHYLNINQLTISFTAPFSGTVLCN